VFGASDCGPKTLNVIVPLALLIAPDSAELMAPAPIAVPAMPVAGPVAVMAVAFFTTVDAIPAPQPLFDGELVASPL
jgi:hypothetical protein